ncbi:putative glioma tumor suppressor candidate region 1 protein isoform 2 [Scophthalmus maximus]|uniref:Putative glioma tumor suppressor candidate region 1 protein isoform 2 n=1 Tax=Scophthalmus maximus TaxID=52904 RepID=A0A2U9B3X6_SCOMX|nr:putative glioma tumor suppressor candidate region 1 protein isoform 2 [Scophthalmus maximus]
MDDEDGRCLLDVICDPEALNDFLHGSETHGHVPEVQPAVQLSASEPAGLPRVSVDLDFLEDEDILGGSPGGEVGSNGIGTNHEPCDILQQSLAEANITEQSLQEAEAELDLGSFGIPGLTQVVQTLPDASLSGAGGAAVGVGIGVGGAATIFPGSAPSTTATPPNSTADMLGSVLAQQGLQLQPQVMNKAISVQPFMQPVGLGNVTLQPISSLQALPNGSQSGHLGIGQIQVVGQPTVMTINQSGQPILAKAMGGYQLHQSGQEVSGAGSQAGLGGQGGGLLIQGNKATLGSPGLNGPAVCVSSTNSSSGGTMTAPAGLLGFGSNPLSSGIGPHTQTQGQIMQNVIIQRTPTPIQPKPPQGGAIQPKLFKQQSQQQQAPQPLQNDAQKALGMQQIPVSSAQNVTFLTGKPGSNVVLTTQATTQGPQFQQTLFKQQGAQPSGKPLSVHLLNQQGSIVIPPQNHQLFLPQLQAGGQILAQHHGGHIITSQGPGGQLIANQILTANQNINLGQMLASQGHPGAAQILSRSIQLQSGQMGTPTLFQMPVSLAQSQSQTQTHTVSGHAQTVIQGMPIQNSLTMLSQVEGLSPAVTLQPALQQQPGGVPNSSSTGAATMGQGQSGECVTVLGSSTDQAVHPAQQHVQQSSILTMQPASSVSTAIAVPCSSPSISVSTPSSVTAVGLVPHQAQHSPGRLLLTNQGSSMILSQESLQMFLQQEQHHQTENESTPSMGVPASVIVSSNSIAALAPAVHDSQLTDSWVGQSHSPSPGPSHMTAVLKQIPSSGHQQPLKIQGMSSSTALTTHTSVPPMAESPQPSQSPLTLSQQIQSPHHQQQSRPPSQPQPQSLTPSRSCTPSSHPPLFIVHNQITESSQGQPKQTQLQQAHIQVQLQTQPRPASQPAPYQQDMPPISQSPKPPTAQHQFTAPPVSTSAAAVVKAQVPLTGLTADQQHHLQLIGAQIQTLSGIAQPSPQQKQLLDKLHQVQQTILLQTKQPAQPQSQATGQFGSQQDVPVDKVVITSTTSTGTPSQLPSMLQPTPVLVKTPATATSDLQIQVLGAGLTQMPAPQPPAPAQTQTTTMNMPFSAEPSKEARMLEQLRKQQGSALHPNYSAPFYSFEDTLHRLLPYHLYQGTANSSQDYQRVDEEFERVSSQLLKRTQAMLDKYRHLLFAESKRLGPSAEMVMIDRMFIQEEKVALSQDRILAKERPERTVIASVKVEKRGREASHALIESSHDRGRLGSAMPGLNEVDEVFSRGMKSTQHHHIPPLLDKDGAKERAEEHADQETDVSKYKRAGGKNRHRVGGTFRMDQHAPGPPSPESSFTRDSLLPAKRCKSDSPDMDNASFSSGSPPDDSLNEHLQCAIDSILNLQQEPTSRGRHIKGGNSRPHQHQSQRPGGSAASSHRPSVPTPSSASSSPSLAQHPQVGGRGHNGGLSISMSRWGRKNVKKAPEVIRTVTEGLKSLYRKKLLPLEQYYGFHDFHSPSLEDADFDNKPMVLVVGQYSTGKTTFIKYLLEQEIPGSRIGPEPTTDCFTAIMHGEVEGVIPGNALIVDPNKPFRKLNPFGNTFLNRFQCAQIPNQVLESISIIDSPGILSGAKQRLSRGYDFPAVLRWFAERVDRIILLFDAHKLEISDEFAEAIGALKGNEDKLRVVLNKADMVGTQQLMRVYGALMWSLGKVFGTPEVLRVYIGSFWSEPLMVTDNRKLFELEEEDLFADIQNLPRNAALRKLNDLVKRARLVRVHAHIISYLKQEMPSVFRKDYKKKNLIYQLPVIFSKIQLQHNISAGDFPDCAKMQEQLNVHDFTKFKTLKPNLMAALDELLSADIATLMPLLRQEELEAGDQLGVQGGAFVGTRGGPFGEGDPFAEHNGENCEEEDDWVVTKDKPKYDEIFYNLAPDEGKLSGHKAKDWMVSSRLPNSVLGRIWKLSDVDRDGMLDDEEFALASHLIEVKLEGHGLPPELPSRLVPPSKRRQKGSDA